MWILDHSPDSTENQLARLILSKLNWGYTEQVCLISVVVVSMIVMKFMMGMRLMLDDYDDVKDDVGDCNDDDRDDDGDAAAADGSDEGVDNDDDNKVLF